MNKATVRIGLIAIITLFVVHMAILPDYGLTWDFHFHFFAGANFLGLKPEDVEPRTLPYVAPDPRISIHLPYGPFVQIVPFASWLLLYKNLHLLPYDVAYNLPIVIAGVLGIAFLYFFLAESIPGSIPGIKLSNHINFTALLAMIFLALTPRYFADIHNNMKDAPEASVFALNIWMLWRLVKYRRIKDLLLASVAFALAFNTKINSIFIPVIFAAWLLLLSIKGLVYSIKESRTNKSKLLFAKLLSSKATKLPLSYFILAPLAAFLLWWFFWGDPIGQLKLAVATFGWGADNIEVLLNGRWFCAGSTVPWYYPYWYLAITTPIPILLFFIVGLGAIIGSFIKRSIHKHQASSIKLQPSTKPQSTNSSVWNLEFGAWDLENATGILLLLWFSLPLTRYLLPKIAVIDGVRHFEEILYPMAAIAAIGATKTITWLQHLLPHKSNAICVAVATGKTILFCGILIVLILPIIRYHPFQISYFNELVGDIRGAMGKYDIDYWGSSQKKAAEWLNQNAPNDANVHVVMAADVAGLYLRPDLLTRLNSVGYDGADYVVVLNRQSFFYRYYYLFEYLLRRKPAYVVENQGVPIVWVFDNRTPPIPRQMPWWKGEDPCIQKYW